MKRLLFLVAALFLTNCVSNEKSPEEYISSTETDAAPYANEIAENEVTDDDQIGGFGEGDDSPTSVEDSIVYFDYNSSLLTSKGMRKLEVVKRLLDNNPEKKYEIGGHCDERGSHNFNVALGLARANRVKDYLIELGVPASQLTAISYGESQPVVEGAWETSWQENRRANFRQLF